MKKWTHCGTLSGGIETAASATVGKTAQSFQASDTADRSFELRASAARDWSGSTRATMRNRDARILCRGEGKRTLGRQRTT